MFCYIPLGVNEEKRKLAKSALSAEAKLKQELSRDGSTWTVKVVTPAGEKVDVYPEGKPVQALTLDGRSVSVRPAFKYAILGVWFFFPLLANLFV